MIVSLEIYDSLFEDGEEEKANETRKDCLRRWTRKKIIKFFVFLTIFARKISLFKTRTSGNSSVKLFNNSIIFANDID